MATSEQVFNGTAGTALVAPTTSGGNSWTYASTPAGTSSDAAHNATQSVRGSMSGRCNDTTTGAYSYETPDANTMYFRGYFYLTAAPSANFSIARYIGSGYAASSQVIITSDRKLAVASNQTLVNRTDSVSGSATYSSSTNAIPLNEWFRIEVLMTQTTWRAKMWKASGAGMHANGTPDVDSGDVTGTTIGTLNTLTIGPAITWNGTSGYTFLSSGQYLYADDFATSTTGYVGPSVLATTADAALSETATLTSAATRVAVGTASLSGTAAMTATSGIAHAADAALSATATASSDASVITTHSAECAPIATGALAATVTVTRSAIAELSTTASLTALMASDTEAALQVLGVMTCRAVVEGETSPGFLYSTVQKNVLTN